MKKLTRQISDNNHELVQVHKFPFNHNTPAVHQLYFDSFISPDFFKNQFVHTFGIVCYWIEKLGIYFATFLFVKLLIEIILTFLKALHLQRIIGRTVSLGQTLLAVTHDFFALLIFKQLFHDNTPEELELLEENNTKTLEATPNLSTPEKTDLINDVPSFKTIPDVNIYPILPHQLPKDY